MSRCYLIPTKDGYGSIRIQATTKPDKKATKALQDLFEAAVYAAERLSAHQLNPARIAEASAEIGEDR